MRRTDWSAILSLVLLGSVLVTAGFGLVQSNLDLHKFRLHKYSAYLTLFLAAIHVLLKSGNLWKRLRRKPNNRRGGKGGRGLYQREA